MDVINSYTGRGSDFASPAENNVSLDAFVLLNSNPAKSTIIMIKRGRNIQMSRNCTKASQYLSIRVSNETLWSLLNR